MVAKAWIRNYSNSVNMYNSSLTANS